MAKAIQLPSGSWRVRVYDKETGKRLSFTSQLPGKAGKNEAEYMAKQWQSGRKAEQIRKASGKTVRECVEEYILSKENLLSPSSIRGYYLILNNALDKIGNISQSAPFTKSLYFVIVSKYRDFLCFEIV